MYLFIHKYLMSTYWKPGTLPGSGNIPVRKIKSLLSWSLETSTGRQTINKYITFGSYKMLWRKTKQIKGVTDGTTCSQQSVRKDHTEVVIFEQEHECSKEVSHANIPWEEQVQRPWGESVLGMSEGLQEGQRGCSEKRGVAVTGSKY